MAIESYTTQLERVQAAIKAIESGSQSYSVAGQSFTKGDLKTLYDREERLRPLAARESGSASRLRQAVPL